MTIENEILLANYWEHQKFAKELARFLDASHTKRVKIQKQLNEIQAKLPKVSK